MMPPGYRGSVRVSSLLPPRMEGDILQRLP